MKKSQKYVLMNINLLVQKSYFKIDGKAPCVALFPGIKAVLEHLAGTERNINGKS